MERIPVAGPWITDREVKYVADAAANAWYSNANMYHERFERAMADYIGVKHAIALPSCTSAIHLALMSLGVGPGDEVIVPEITWIASAAPIKYVGATTVFADVDEKTWCMSADSFERCITPRTKAVIPVDLYGGMPDMEALEAVAAKHNVAIIEDAAEAAGAIYKNRKAGSFGVAGTFSFHGSKTLTTGEGGMLMTNSDELRQRSLFLRDHGRKPGDCLFWNAEVAYKYKMSSMQAALGLAQLERIEELIARKQQIFGWYHERIGDMPGVAMNYQPPQTRNAYWMVSAVLDERYQIDKKTLMDRLSQQGIDRRPFFHPLSSIPAYQDSTQAADARQRNAVSYRISRCAINLPSALMLTEQQVDRVCKAFGEIVR